VNPSRNTISLQPASSHERLVLDNLVQLYCHDWSELVPLDVGVDGRFSALALEPYWSDDWRRPCLIRVGEKLAGFALIEERSRLTGARGVFDMAEFFVLRRYRRQGVGHAAAVAAFEQFKGPWEIRQRDENLAAVAFWRRVIADYTGGRYQEARPSSGWKGVVQTFSTR
jgi:predicted acetyltransferase